MGGTKVEEKMQVSNEEMDKEDVPLPFRDYCAHLLIPLNKCRRKNFHLPFRCNDERHVYEKCQYDHYVRRVEKMAEQVRAERLKEIEAREEKIKQAAREAATVDQ